MVYRGKPSAGCENCRKAKKRCGLEQPACLRCVKLKKTCSGYRDTTQLQIQDETEGVKAKAKKQQTKNSLAPPTKTDTLAGIPTPGSINSDSSSSSDGTIDLDMSDAEVDRMLFGPTESIQAGLGMSSLAIHVGIRPKPDDIATTYFFKQFTSNGHWDFIRGFASQRKMDPCLELAIKACGMAALDNVQNVVMGRDYSRSMYVEALGILNETLRDPKRCKTDEALIAVAMLGYYENLTCEGRQSISSWKAHVSGAAQMLKLRGKAQFKTKIGRLLFRESRAQILIACIWDDREPPPFLWEYQEELAAQTIDTSIFVPTDAMTKLCFEFAQLRSQMFKRTIADTDAAARASELERKFIQWQIDTASLGESWRYTDIEVPDSKHVWDGRVHSYYAHPAPSVWNTWRGMRILLSRTQELLCRRFQFSDDEKQEQMQYFRKVRRQMTDEICLGLPSNLGHASPAFNSPCVLITAYSSIWPLFFAGTCALERVGPGAYSILTGQSAPSSHGSSAAWAQANWIVGRLYYISEHIGLKWADGIAATLRGDFNIHDEQMLEYNSPTMIQLDRRQSQVHKMITG